VLGGFMREQVCIYMCPWPRIQTAMLDEKSLIVTYKDWRGEPRGSVKKAEKNPGGFGDCIDCNQCVNVCPTGYRHPRTGRTSAASPARCASMPATR
jgi:polyferredoxin